MAAKHQTTQLPASVRNGERPPARSAIVFGLSVMALFFGAFAVWGGTAPLDSAAIAPGSVRLDTNRKTVQHLEGGIVRRIDVREGARVKSGQVLITLDTTRTKAQIRLLRAQLGSVKKQIDLISQEISDVSSLRDKGLVRKPVLLALQRRKAELLGQQSKHRSAMAVARDSQDRSTVRAPIAGTVVDLRVHTPGGVIKAGDPLLTIVPAKELLVIEARVSPNDIDIVRAGMKANVRLTPYGAREVPPVAGSVEWVSADRMTDKNDGARYYLARITLGTDAGSLGPNVRLYPGMPAEVMIVTGRRTLLDYLFSPLLRSFRRAFREE